MKPIWFAILLVACKSQRTEHDPPPSAERPPETATTDPACAAKVAELEPFLAQLYTESASHEINFFWTPQIVALPATPIDRDNVDYVVLAPAMKAAFDVSEANHIDNKLGVGPERLATIFAIKSEPRAKHTTLRLDVDVKTTWGDVAGVVDGAQKAGYSEVLFAFETESKLVAPPGVASKTETTEVYDKAVARRAELGKVCEPLGMVGLNSLNDSKLEMAKLRAKYTAAALATCNCTPSPDEVKAILWQTERWVQAATRTSITIKLAPDPASSTTIIQPAATPWSEAHRVLLPAAGKAARLVAGS